MVCPPEGEIHEAMNLAGTHNCRSSSGAKTTVTRSRYCSANKMGVEIADRAAGYGFPGVVVDGAAMCVVEATQAAVERSGGGDGPTLLEFKCAGLTPHSSDDNDRIVPTCGGIWKAL